MEQSYRNEYGTVVFSEPTIDDQRPFLEQGFRIDFENRIKVTVTYNDGRSGYCFMEKERVNRLGHPYIVDHARLSSALDEWRVDISENDYYNDLQRNPELVISVEYVGIESGTGREIYRSAVGATFYREVFYPRESCAKWWVQIGKNDIGRVRPNVIFDHNGQREKTRYDDWNDSMAYSDLFNVKFNEEGVVCRS